MKSHSPLPKMPARTNASTMKLVSPVTRFVNPDWNTAERAVLPISGFSESRPVPPVAWLPPSDSVSRNAAPNVGVAGAPRI